MSTKSENLSDALRKSSHPLAQKFRDLEQEAFSTPNTDTAIKYLSDWKKNNPEETIELRDFVREFHDEFKESRREVKSELGYSRVGLNNI